MPGRRAILSDRRTFAKFCATLALIVGAVVVLQPRLRMRGRTTLEIGRARTTPPPRIDILEALPELAALAKTTIRLHPRRLEEGEPLAREASKLGGEFLWPASEPWPSCPLHELPHVGVLQLRKADFPEVEFRPGADLLQLTWCPQRGHGKHHGPEPSITWRDASKAVPPAEVPRPRLPSADDRIEEGRQSALEHDLQWLALYQAHPAYVRQISGLRGAVPSPSSRTRLPRAFLAMPLRTDAEFEAARREAARLTATLVAEHRIPLYAEEDFLPRPCRLFPERVAEYPAELSESQKARLAPLSGPAPGRRPGRRDPEGVLEVYERELSVADGTKLLGFPGWSQAPETPRCAEGHAMDHLLTVAGAEWDGANWRRWRAAEERTLSDSLQANGNFRAANALQSPSGLTLGDQAKVYVFLCRKCEAWPVRSIMQD